MSKKRFCNLSKYIFQKVVDDAAIFLYTYLYSPNEGTFYCIVIIFFVIKQLLYFFFHFLPLICNVFSYLYADMSNNHFFIWNFDSVYFWRFSHLPPCITRVIQPTTFESRMYANQNDSIHLLQFSGILTFNGDTGKFFDKDLNFDTPCISFCDHERPIFFLINILFLKASFLGRVTRPTLLFEILKFCPLALPDLPVLTFLTKSGCY